MPDTTKTIIEFSDLPADVRHWLFSALCAYEVGKIVDQVKPPEDKTNILALAIGQVAMKDLDPKNFTATIAREWGISLDAAKKIGLEVKNAVLKPIAGSLWKNLQINLDDLTKIPEIVKPPAPQRQPEAVKPIAREVKMEPFSAPRGASQGKPQPVQTKGWQETPKARVMEFAPMTDVRKPDGAKPASLPASAGQPTPKAPAPTVNQPEKPFGLSEAAPKNPEPHELTEYKDEHPMAG